MCGIGWNHTSGSTTPHYAIERWNLLPKGWALGTSGHWHHAFRTTCKKSMTRQDSNHRYETNQTANGHSRSSRDEAARFRVCQGKKFQLFWQLGSISCRCKEILSLKLHPSVGPVTLIILRLCHPQKKRKTNWQPPSRESLRKSYCSFSATSMPALMLIKAHSPFVWISFAFGRWTKTANAC